MWIIGLWFLFVHWLVVLSVHWLVVFVCESWQEWAAAAVPDGLIAEVPVSAAAAVGARQPSMPPPPPTARQPSVPPPQQNILGEASTGASTAAETSTRRPVLWWLLQ